MRTIKKKLNSQRGASLTFALLLFLVCAVVGSVVLVAGTAASGRMSKVAEMDQRYYSVNSAARLLIDMIDDETVMIIATQERLNPVESEPENPTDPTEPTDPENATDPTEPTDPTDPTEPAEEAAEYGDAIYEYEDEDGDHKAVNPESFDSIIKEAAYYYIMDIEPDNYSDRKPGNGADYRYVIKLTAGGNGVDDKMKSAMEVTIKEELGNDGKMILTVDQNDEYAVILIFSPDVEKTLDEQETQKVTTWKIGWNFQKAEVVSGVKRVK